MNLYTIPCYDGVHVNGTLVLQSCTDSQQVLPGSSSETLLTASDGTYVVNNVKIEEEIDIKEEDEVNVKEEEDISSEEDIKDEEGIYSEEEEEEDIDTKEYKEVEVKEEVS